MAAAPAFSIRVVPMFLAGPKVELLLVGEAPGPRGADRTGFPFWGDDSGLDLYGLIASLGLMEAPFVGWKRRSDLSGTQPPAGRYGLTNACSRMPLGEGDATFAAPPEATLREESIRLAADLERARPRAVLACGKAAAFGLARAAEKLGSTPPAALGPKLANVKLLEATGVLLDAPSPWRIGTADVWLTCHPARGQWSPKTASGRLHAGVVERLRAALAR